MTNYVGILDGTGKALGVRIPDMHGATAGAGASVEAAIDDATSAASAWLTHQSSKGLAHPKPRDLAAIIKAGEFDTTNNETAVTLDSCCIVRR